MAGRHSVGQHHRAGQVGWWREQHSVCVECMWFCVSQFHWRYVCILTLVMLLCVPSPSSLFSLLPPLSSLLPSLSSLLSHPSSLLPSSSLPPLSSLLRSLLPPPCVIGHRLGSFMGLANSFDQYPREWHLWYTSAEPESTRLPGECGVVR